MAWIVPAILLYYFYPWRAIAGAVLDVQLFSVYFFTAISIMDTQSFISTFSFFDD